MTGLREGPGGNLPAFSIRVSSRARHVRLVMSGRGELVVVVPRRFDPRKVPAIVETKLPWIERTRARLQARRAFPGTLPALDEPSLPERIVLPALGEVWEVEHRLTSRPGGTVREAAGARLVVTRPAADEEAGRLALVRWLRRRALTELPERLEELARLHGLRFGGVTVRHQRTRWGSCSPQRAIWLNLSLLFLHPALVDYVLLHELCHTREMNHSKRFWALLEVHDPHWRAHRRETREAWRTLPQWLHPGESGPDL